MRKFLLAIAIVCFACSYGLAKDSFLYTESTLLGASNATDGVEAAPYDELGKDDPRTGFLNVTTYGTWNATITIQRKVNGQDTYRDVTDDSGNVKNFTSNVNGMTITDYEQGNLYRAIIKSGEYTSGNATVRISH